MELFHASNQWATRPADQRFQSLQAMRDACFAYAVRAAEKVIRWTQLRVEATDTGLALTGTKGIPARLTHYAFGQLANRVGAPASYIRALPATLAAQNLNHGLKNKEDADAVLLFHRDDDGLLLRAATSDRYSRIWNYEVIDRLLELESRFGLVPGQQTFTWGQQGQTFVPREDAEKSLYASDHDMFAFVMTPQAIKDPTGNALRRGLIAINSEVGDKSLKVMGFYFRDVCANHIIWGAEQITEVSLRHVGNMNRKLYDAKVEITRYLNSSTSEDQDRVLKLSTRIAADKDELLDKLFGVRSLGLSRKALEASYDAVRPDEDGDPLTQWGFAQGITRFSQATPYADERFTLDRAAGKLLEIEF